MLQAHPDTDALFACSDLMALGALEAIAAAGRPGGSASSDSTRWRTRGRRSRPGRMEASVAQSPRDMGRIAVESAAKLLRGETVPADQKVPIAARDQGCCRHALTKKQADRSQQDRGQV